MKKVLVSCAALCLIVASCKKKEGDPSRTDMLTNGKWRMTALKATTTILGTDTTADLFATFDDCEKDDLTIFRSDKHLISDEGATKCVASNPQQTDEGTWNLTESDTKLVMLGGMEGTYKINSISSSNLQLQRDTTVFGFPAQIVASFTHEN